MIRLGVHYNVSYLINRVHERSVYYQIAEFNNLSRYIFSIKNISFKLKYDRDKNILRNIAYINLLTYKMEHLESLFNNYFYPKIFDHITQMPKYSLKFKFF